MRNEKLVRELSDRARSGITNLIMLCLSGAPDLPLLVPAPLPQGMEETPDRVIKAFEQQTIGYQQDPARILLNASGEVVFHEEFDEMIVLRDIEFSSLCEHHLLPFFGTATVGYIPNGGVVGVSKLARLVDCFAKRFQVQERMTKQIADALEQHLHPRGVGVIVEAKHQCMTCRGVAKQNASMVTSVVRGFMKDDAKAREEFLAFRR